MATRRVGRIPDDLTSFVGRRGAITQVKRLLSSSRLVTLTGVPGVGKSRLATRVARDLRRAFPDGIRLVELSEIPAHGDLAQVLVSSLGLRGAPPGAAEDLLAERLADKRMLIVLDGCEHLLDECGPLVNGLLTTAPELRVLVTSRAPLAIAGEQVWSVPPLLMPQLDEQGRVVRRAVGHEALELFADRASAVLPGFTIGPDNEADVVRLCHQLDGLPLAIELAAVWMRSLSVSEVLARLTDRYRLLTWGDRSASPHHQSLRAAVEWSYDLCSPVEQSVWARLSVFAHGFELEAAEAVCVGDGVTVEDVFVGVAGLVEKSVLVKEDPQHARTRYRLLRTIREYGRERLGGGTKELVLRRRHRDHFLLLAERVDAEWLGPDQVEWLARLRLDRENLRGALRFCCTEPGEADEALRMAAALRFFWLAGGTPGEAVSWLGEALQVSPEPSPQRARALLVDALITGWQGDSGAALDLLAEGQEVARQVRAEAVLGLVPHIAGLIDMVRDRHEAAMEWFAEALEQEEVMLHDGLAMLSMASLASLHVFHGDLPRALDLCRRCREICAEHGEKWARSWCELVLGLVRWQQGDLDAAVSHLHECLRTKQLFGDVPGVLLAVEIESWVAAGQGRAARAAQLSAAVSRLWQPMGSYLFGLRPYLAWHAETEARIRNALPTADLRTARRRGAESTLDEVLRFALGERHSAPAMDTSVRLTPREREVAGLVAQGLSNRQIAEQLVISKRTSDSHIEHIMAKLGVTSRAQIAVWVAEQA
ncbi:non-specific serine/threonine protein kinase [Saccharopolyspora kobensis]|uniref:Non-specific serine/threonine protein kinase n=1 Tax=Saccharopolyspora kobensis TaxID=146035 RepID=A0A1H6EES3_9PSEU|nr:LuxR C-terminal-related transcriptional regulator [Saccharopolyspora kobensis]SEG96282.1 non-specific serine/threonine protein kinase [Saccharopolyspora kobensis]SFD20750.1 non-specific serine/threonine protein kinase [Saccharopolyspora kobensis]